MSDIVTVFGAPGSGQTSVAMKLAVEVYHELRNVAICFVSMDYEVPSIGLLFPNKKTSEIASAAELLDKTDMTTEHVLRSLVTVPNMKNFACLGLKAGENKYSYPIPDKQKVEALFKVLQRDFNYIFVDYTPGEELSRYALTNSDRVIRVMSPDLKSITWLTASKHICTDSDNRLLNVVNITDKDSFLPTEEVCTHIKSVTTILPYSRSIRQQMLDGELWLRPSDKLYTKKIAVLVEKTLDPAGKGRDSIAEQINENGFAV